jgi:hypothetical protein
VKIVQSRKVEDCFDGSSVYAYSFDEAWNRGTIASIQVFGKLEYYPDFPRPFFRVRGCNGLEVKGVEGERNCRVVFPRRERETIKRQFEETFPVG